MRKKCDKHGHGDITKKDLFILLAKKLNMKKCSLEQKNVVLFASQSIGPPDYESYVVHLSLTYGILNSLPSLLNKVIEALDIFAQAIESTSNKTGDHSASSAGQAGTYLVDGEKNTQQLMISQFF